MEDNLYETVMKDIKSRRLTMDLAIIDAKDAIQVLTQLVVEQGYSLTKEQLNGILEISNNTNIIAQEGYSEKEGN